MSAELLLGLDIGTSSAKGVLARPDGTVVAVATRPHGISMPRPGWVEHDAESVWWDGVRALCAELLPAARAGLAGVCVSGIGPCLLPCDGALRPLRPAILYGIDTRATVEGRELEERLGADAILARGGAALSSQALGPKLLWLQRHEPELWRETAGWYMASSFVVARLTGEHVLDHHSASQCNPLYDLDAAAWAEPWADELAGGVPLPRLAWPAEIVGSVTPAGAEGSGIPAGTPVLAGTVDAWAESFSVGVRRPGDLMLMYGSTMFLIQVTAGRVRNETLWSAAGVEPGVQTVAAGTATAGTVVDWVRELAGGAPFEELVAEATAVGPGAGGLLVLPYFAGERGPVFDPDARGVVLGLTLSHRRGHLLRAVYEGIACGVRHNLEVFAEAAGPPERVVAVGGGTQGGLWTQIVSDVTGLEQSIPKQTIGAAYGDALMAAIATGLVPGAEDWTEESARIAPSGKVAEGYDELFELYRRAYPATRPVVLGLASARENLAKLEGIAPSTG